MLTPSVEPNASVTYKVRYEDEHLLVIDKPARVPTQPGKGHLTDTLLNGLFAHHAARLQNLGRARDFGLVHRLDKDTSGLLVVALTGRAYDALRSAFATRDVAKHYWAVCAKAPDPPEGVVKLAIAETHGGGERQNAMKLAHIHPGGKPAATAFRTLDASDMAALIEARPLTGRLHQVRVHLKAIGSPIVGDPLYAPKSYQRASARLALHAHRLCFTHPETGERVDVRSRWPSDLRRLLRVMKLARPDHPSPPTPPAGSTQDINSDAT